MNTTTSPAPPVAFKDHCAIIHNNTLFVYSPDAFQTLELQDGAQWKQLQNGESVHGGVCVKGGIEGDQNNPALYIVGGTTSNADYSGLQRFSIQDQSWTSITPQVKVTAQRQYHGAAYLNASSALIIYGGSQNGNQAPSTETFLMLMYAPYAVQAYSSTAPPVVSPQIHSWDEERAVMVGGSATNQNVFVFHPDNSWQDLGVTLPEPLADSSTTQTSLVTLDDNSKVLLTYRMGQSPNVVSRNVLMGAFNAPAQQGQTVGDPVSSSPSPASRRSRIMKRLVSLQNYPTYNATDASTDTRTNFAVAQGSNELSAIVGGDTQDSTVFFGKLDNTWISADSILGDQQPLVSTTPSATASPTMSATPSASSPAAPPPAAGNGPNTMAILGGVLGGICGLAAILIIILLWLRQARKRKAQATQMQSSTPHPEENKDSFDGAGLQRPLANQGQPMGRSPVPSAVVDDRDSIAMFNPKFNEKAYELGANKSNQPAGSGLLPKNPFTRQQSPLTISKPMLADLGDYKERPSIELGKATPMAPVVVNPSNLSVVTTALPEVDTKKDQRKTDEGWAAYFQSFQSDGNNNATKRDTVATTASSQTTSSAPPSRSGRGAFWPGSGVTEKTRASKPAPLRDDARSITTSQVVAASPTLQHGPSNPRTLTMSTAEGIPAKISRAESISTEATDDDDYEDDRLSAYSSGVPQVAQHTSWTPFGNGSSSHIQTIVHRSSNAPSTEVRPVTTVSNDTINSGTTKSSIPTFPMPAASIRRVQPSGELQPPRAINPNDYRTSEDYFGKAPGALPTSVPVELPVSAQKRTSYQRPQPPNKTAEDSNDMSWINLGTPNPNQ